MTHVPAQTPAQTIDEALDLIAQAFTMEKKVSGNAGLTPKLMMERAKTMAFVATAQTVLELAAASASTDRPASDRLLAGLLALQAAVTPPIAAPPTPTPSPPAATAPAVITPTVTVPTPPVGGLLTTYAAAWSDGYRAGHPSGFTAGHQAAWPTAHAAGYRAGHPAGFAAGVADEAAALLHLIATALTNP